MPPLLGFDNLLEQLTELRKHLLTFTSLLYNKGYEKDTGEQPYEELHRAISECRHFCRDVPPSRYADMFTNLEAPQNLVLLGFLWRLHHEGMIHYYPNL